MAVKELLKILQEKPSNIPNMYLLNIMLKLIDDDIENTFIDNIKKLEEEEFDLLILILLQSGYTEEYIQKLMV